MRKVNHAFILFFAFTTLLFTNIDAQGYYKFSDKVHGDFSDEGKIAINFYAGVGIPIALTYSAEVEYTLRASNISFGANIIRQTYSEDVIFDFQDFRDLNTLTHIFGKYTYYPTNGRLSLHGATGVGVGISTYVNSFDKTTYVSWMFQGGIKYRISNVIGIGAVLYYSIEPCVAGGVSVSF